MTLEITYSSDQIPVGTAIAAFSGDDVYWEVPEDLPQMTKLMVDGKAFVYTIGQTTRLLIKIFFKDKCVFKEIGCFIMIECER